MIASGAIRLDGTSKEYMPIEFPAVADFGITMELANAAKSLGHRYHVGVVQSKDSFYGQHSPESMPTSDELSYKWRAWMKGGCLASEMESSTLFIVSAVRNLRSGALFHCVWNQQQAGQGMPVQRTHDTSAVIKTAVEAMRNIILKDKKL